MHTPSIYQVVLAILIIGFTLMTVFLLLLLIVRLLLNRKKEPQQVYPSATLRKPVVNQVTKRKFFHFSINNN